MPKTKSSSVGRCFWKSSPFLLILNHCLSALSIPFVRLGYGFRLPLFCFGSGDTRKEGEHTAASLSPGAVRALDGFQTLKRSSERRGMKSFLAEGWPRLDSSQVPRMFPAKTHFRHKRVGMCSGKAQGEGAKNIIQDEAVKPEGDPLRRSSSVLARRPAAMLEARRVAWG